MVFVFVCLGVPMGCEFNFYLYDIILTYILCMHMKANTCAVRRLSLNEYIPMNHSFDDFLYTFFSAIT